jgi:hypothetical protein
MVNKFSFSIGLQKLFMETMASHGDSIDEKINHLVIRILYLSNKPNREISDLVESELENYGQKIPEFYRKLFSRCVLHDAWGKKSFIIKPKEVA